MSEITPLLPTVHIVNSEIIFFEREKEKSGSKIITADFPCEEIDRFRQGVQGATIIFHEDFPTPCQAVATTGKEIKAIVANRGLGKVMPADVLMRIDKGRGRFNSLVGSLVDPPNVPAELVSSSINIVNIVRALIGSHIPDFMDEWAVKDEIDLIREGLKDSLIDGILPDMPFSEFMDFLNEDFVQLVNAHSDNPDHSMDLKFRDHPLLTTNLDQELLLLNGIKDRAIRLAVMRLRQRTRRTLLFDSTVLRNDEKRRFAQIIAAVQPTINNFL